MTPIQQAIEQVKKDIVNFNQQRNMCYPPRCDEWKSYDAKIEKSQIILNYLQSLLPVEKEWAESVYDDGADGALSFETIYSQLNEVK